MLNVLQVEIDRFLLLLVGGGGGLDYLLICFILFAIRAEKVVWCGVAKIIARAVIS